MVRLPPVHETEIFVLRQLAPLVRVTLLPLVITLLQLCLLPLDLQLLLHPSLRIVVLHPSPQLVLEVALEYVVASEAVLVDEEVLKVEEVASLVDVVVSLEVRGMVKMAHFVSKNTPFVVPQRPTPTPAPLHSAEVYQMHLLALVQALVVRQLDLPAFEVVL